jgi:hypothetical protein
MARQVSTEEGQAKAIELKALFIETSALVRFSLFLFLEHSIFAGHIHGEYCRCTHACPLTMHMFQLGVNIQEMFQKLGEALPGVASPDGKSAAAAGMLYYDGNVLLTREHDPPLACRF